MIDDDHRQIEMWPAGAYSFHTSFGLTGGTTLRAFPALVPRQIVTALPAMAWWDAASVAVPEDGGGNGCEQEGEPERHNNSGDRAMK